MGQNVSDKHITPAQAAALLSVSSSTLRAWSVAFGEHLSPSAKGGGGRKRSYTADDLATLQRAAALIREGHSPIEAADLLGLTDQTPAAALVALPDMAAALQQSHALVMRLAGEVAALRDDLQAQQTAHAQDLAAVRADFGRVLEHMARQRERQRADLEALAQRLEETQARRPPWWRRLFNRPK